MIAGNLQGFSERILADAGCGRMVMLAKTTHLNLPLSASG